MSLKHDDCGGAIIFRPDFYGQNVPCVEVVCEKCETHLGVLYDVTLIEEQPEALGKLL